MNNKVSKHCDVKVAIQEYERIRPTYERFTAKLAALLRELLEAESIEYETLDPRTKEVEKFANKIQRPGKSYIDPIREVTDLSGLRIVVYYIEDVDRVAELIKKEFEIDREHTVDKGQTLEPHEFGYRSIHFVISLQKQRTELKEWSRFSTLKAEIQVRTVLQHAWASASRAFDYTQEAETPVALRRRLFRLAGLFELADQEFSAIRAAHAVETKRIVESIKRGDENVELNLDSIREYLNRSSYLKDLTAYAKSLGFEIQKEGINFATDLLRTAQIFEIKNVNDLARAIEIPAEIAKTYLRAQWQAGGEQWIIDLPFLAELMLIRAIAPRITPKELVKWGGWSYSIAKTVVGVAKEHNKWPYDSS